MPDDRALVLSHVGAKATAEGSEAETTARALDEQIEVALRLSPCPDHQETHGRPRAAHRDVRRRTYPPLLRRVGVGLLQHAVE